MKRVVYLILLSLLAFTSCKKESNPTSPAEDTSTVTYSGKVYHTVKIGTQTWLKENLDVGVMIDSMQNPSNNVTIEKYCYGNDTANCNKYGGLYQWNEAMEYSTTPGAKGICPTGWHIPTQAEFDTLVAAVGNNGNSLKAIGQGDLKYGGAGTDSSGFSALLVGYRLYYGNFSGLGDYSVFWSSTMDGTTSTYNLTLWDGGSDFAMYSNHKEYGYNIRCLKD